MTFGENLFFYQVYDKEYFDCFDQSIIQSRHCKKLFRYNDYSGRYSLKKSASLLCMEDPLAVENDNLKLYHRREV